LGEPGHGRHPRVLRRSFEAHYRRRLHGRRASRIETLTEPGRYSDGGNLYLFITLNGGKRWTFLYRLGGKRLEMGLSSAGPHGVGLKEARDKAADARRLVEAGRDPLEARAAEEKAGRTVPTFGAFADDFIASHRPKFKNAKHAAQWEMTLGGAYCRAIRSKPVNQIDTEAVLSVLKPIWMTVPETASRLRGRIENVLDAARAMGHRDGPNPAAWRGHLKSLLPARQKLTRGHHAALDYDAMPEFMAALRAREGLAARALEFAILTACRSGEVLGARWEEFDLQKAIRTIPGARMKAGLAHRVPTASADEMLATAKREMERAAMAVVGGHIGVDVTRYDHPYVYRDDSGYDFYEQVMRLASGG